MIEHHIDPAREARRQAYIERLYERAGRSCGTYSGLLLEHIQHLLEQDMAEVLGDGDQENHQGAKQVIHIDSNGGSIGRFRWINTDTRRTCSSWTFWGDWWWDTVGERCYHPVSGTGGLLRNQRGG